MPECKRISMWSGPRNISTALMYAFRQRSDTEVFDEPLYAHYLTTTDVRHPGDEEVIAAMDGNGERVVREVLLGACDTPVRFFKNMAHHLAGLDRAFLGEVTNILLTREPRAMLTSLSKQLPDPTLRDTGLDRQVELLDFILESGQTPVVLLAKEILRNPQSVLNQMCELLGLPFETQMLSWSAGPKPEDGVWAKHWYDSVHASTGFAPYEEKRAELPEGLEPLLDECLPYFERLSTYAIKS